MGSKREASSSSPPFFADRSQSSHYSSPSSKDADSTPRPSSHFSASVRKKNNANHRTGQACDRCKIRKIRCDARLGGCSPCQQNNTECKTTDRITGRATSRGYTETIEHENHSLRIAVEELQQQMRELGIEPKPVSNYYLSANTSSNYHWPPTSAKDGQAWLAEQANASAAQQPGGDGGQADANAAADLPLATPTSHGTNYLGLSSGINLSPIKGTSLSVFGMTVDIADFIPQNGDDSGTGSYSNLISLTLGHESGGEKNWRNHLPETLEEYEQHATWYLTTVNTWVPLLDKNNFMAMIRKMYSPSADPAPHEIVMAHMLLALWKYQLGARNNSDPIMQAESNNHYHLALTYFNKLIQGRTLYDLQALTLICAHTRQLPKPGAAWMLSSWVHAIAVDIGFHRSAKNFADGGKKMSPLDIELRKRIYWTLLLINVVIAGRLGRPMPLRMDDMDIEFPDPVPDNAPNEPPSCSFACSIQTMKLTRLYLELYSTIYTIHKQDDYEKTVTRLEVKIQQWKDQVPSYLSDLFLKQAQQEPTMMRVQALWLQAWSTELSILLHHPALCKSRSAEFTARNLKICSDASADLLHVVGELLKLKSLDTNWTSATIYVAATFTLLFAHWQRRDQITSADMKKLRADMFLASEILLEVGNLVGSGARLQLAIAPIMEVCLDNINGHLLQRNATSATPTGKSIGHRAGKGSVATNKSSQSQKATYDGEPPYGKHYSEGIPQANGIVANPGNTYVGTGSTMAQVQNAFTASVQANMTEAAGPQSYQFPVSAYDNNTYNGLAGGLGGQTGPQASAMPLPQAQYNVYGDGTYQEQPQGFDPSPPQAWRQWTETMSRTIDNSSANYDPASALMQLGGRDNTHTSMVSGPGVMGNMAATINNNHVMPMNMTYQWPHMVFNGPNQPPKWPHE